MICRHGRAAARSRRDPARAGERVALPPDARWALLELTLVNELDVLPMPRSRPRSVARSKRSSRIAERHWRAASSTGELVTCLTADGENAVCATNARVRNERGNVVQCNERAKVWRLSRDIVERREICPSPSSTPVIGIAPSAIPHRRSIVKINPRFSFSSLSFVAGACALALLVPACGAEPDAAVESVEGALTTSCIPKALPIAAATASSQQAAAFAPKYAIDGVSTTRWSSDKNTDQWLMLDMGKVVTVASLSINWQTAYSQAYTIQFSPDGVNNWQTIAISGATAPGVQSVAALAVTRYVRVHSTQPTSWGNVSIIDVQVLGTVDSTCKNFLNGPWVFSSEDFDPPTFDASTVYSINGNSIVFTYQGKSFTLPDTIPAGAHFKQNVSVVQGGHYRLRLDVSNLSGATATVWWASLSGAAVPTDYVTADSDGSVAIDFDVTSSPGATPTIELVSKPISVFPGVGVQDFTGTATLTKTN
jgi:hypothetical protein